MGPEGFDPQASEPAERALHFGLHFWRIPVDGDMICLDSRSAPDACFGPCGELPRSGRISPCLASLGPAIPLWSFPPATGSGMSRSNPFRRIFRTSL